MSRTQIDGTQVADGTLSIADLDVTTPGGAVITRLAAGSGISITSTGIDEGTGVVTVSLEGQTVSISEMFTVVDGSIVCHLPMDSEYTFSSVNLTSSGFSVRANPVKVKASVNQAISANVNTKLVFGTIVHAPFSAVWNGVLNRYVAQTSGIYSVKGCTTLNTARAGKLILYKNGVAVENLFNTTPAATSVSCLTGGTEISLLDNDCLELWLNVNGAAIAQFTDTYFSVYRIY